MKKKALNWNQYAFSLFFISLVLLFAACSDNSASSEQEEHIEADGWVLRWPDGSVAYSVYQGKADSSINNATLSVNANCFSEHLSVRFLSADSSNIDAPSDEDHYLDYSVEDSSILDIAECGGWGLHLKGVSEGSTTLRLKVMHGDHYDMITPEIKVIVDTRLDASECPFQEDEDE